MKKIIVLAQLLIVASVTYGQQYPYFSQYFINPYVYNPAAIGNSGYTELNFTYRQQWVGVNDAPVTNAFNFQYPTKNNLSLGVNFYNDKAVLLSTSSFTFGLAYKVPISDDQYFKFGLSAGIGLNNFDLDQVDNPDDPALIGVLNQTSFLSGQFGVYYKLKGLNLGFSLPQLYKYSAVDTVDFQKITIDQFDNYIFTASYKIGFGVSKFGLEPFAMYRKSERLPVIMQAGAMLDYNDVISVGGSYTKDYGGTAYLGVSIKKNIMFSYSYEFAGGQQVSLGQGSHELNFKVRFGKNKHIKEKKLTSQTTTNSYVEQTYEEIVAPVIVQPSIPKPQEVVEENEPVIVEEIVVEESVQEPDEVIIEEEVDEFEELFPDPNFNKPKPAFQPGYYVVLGAFEIYENAVEYSTLLNKKGIITKYGYVEDRGLYYVYNIHTQDFNEAKKLQTQFMKINEFKDAWVFDVR